MFGKFIATIESSFVELSFVGITSLRSRPAAYRDAPDTRAQEHPGSACQMGAVRPYLTRQLGPVVGAMVLLGLAGCTPGGNLPVLPDYSPGAYRLGGGDQIRVLTFGSEQLTGQFRVDDQGAVSMPLVGSVPAAGLTPDQFGAHLSKTLKDKKFLQEPSVSVEVLAYRPIFVLGEVAKPGQYPYSPGMTMLTAVAVAGGFTYRAFEDYASDVRTTGGPAVEGKVTPHSFLAPGDVVKVLERHF